MDELIHINEHAVRETHGVLVYVSAHGRSVHCCIKFADLYHQNILVCNQRLATACNPIGSGEGYCPYWTDMFDHLAADGTGLAGGQVAVVALLEVDADLA